MGQSEQDPQSRDSGRARDALTAPPTPASKVMIVQMPAGVRNERLTNQRLTDANADGWHAYMMRNHNGLLVFVLGRGADAEQKVVMALPDEQFEQPINERLSDEQDDGWRLVALENHNGFLVFLMERST